ncbi:Signal-induced proliferation-associated 1 like 3, variant 2 [Balamuthia mandrillaris]
MFAYAPGYRIEGCKDEDERWHEASESSTSPEMELEQRLFEGVTAYREYFFAKPHRSFIVPKSPGGVLIISLRLDNTCGCYRVLVHSRNGAEAYTVPKERIHIPTWRWLLSLGPSISDVLDVLKPRALFDKPDREEQNVYDSDDEASEGAANERSVPTNGATGTEVVIYALNDRRLVERLVSLDEALPGLQTSKLCIGVVYCGHDQTSENNFFANVDSSQEFEEFLDFLGDTIELNGWDRFAGGLDTTKNRSGTHSVYTSWQDKEIMFHVSTMLPLYIDDPQQLERKKHIGNDRVVIVFKDGEESYSPAAIQSKTNQIVILVQVYNNAELQAKKPSSTFYRVSFAFKDTIPVFPPPIPSLPFCVFEKGPALRDFLFTKGT